MDYKREEKNVLTALAVILGILCFILGLMVGLRLGYEKAVRIEEVDSAVPMAEVEETEPREVTLVHETIVTYKPLPVDYETVEDIEISESDAVLIAKTMFGEYRNANNYEQATQVAWCILNRVDSEKFPNTVYEVVTDYNQFHGYNSNHPVDADLYELACEVLRLWQAEKLPGYRTLDEDYLYFYGDGVVNHYRKNY